MKYNCLFNKLVIEMILFKKYSDLNIHKYKREHLPLTIEMNLV